MQPYGPPPPPAPPDGSGAHGMRMPYAHDASYRAHSPYDAYGSPHIYPAPPAGVASTESSATASLVLGIASLTCFGIFAGIPAIIFGVIARKRIADSNGALRGEGVAVGGIVTGALGSVLSVVTLVLFMLGVLGGIYGAMTAPTASSTAQESASAEVERNDDGAETESIGPHVHEHESAAPMTVVDLARNGGPLKTQLESEAKNAAAAGQTLLVQTTATKCNACREIAIAMRESELDEVLSGVRLVRVDIDAFKSELRAAGLSEPSLPWFFLLDSTLRPRDAISADEWDANVAENIAPVLDEFVRGTFTERRGAAPTEL
jgi:hypothetical protein